MTHVQDIRSLLSETACRLTGDTDFPVSVRLVCQSLRVRIRRRTDLKAAVLVNAGEAPEVLLPARQEAANVASPFNMDEPTHLAVGQRNPRDSWERYLVAHELGHFVLHCARHGKPLGKSEYWIQEELCDCFARWLLLPQKALEKWSSTKVLSFSDVSLDARVKSSLKLSTELQTTAHVPWSIAATRLSDSAADLGFLTVREHDTRRLRVSASTLDRRKEIGRLIPKSSNLGSLLVKQGKANIVPIPAALFVGFQSLPRISAAATQRISAAQWHLALGFK